VVHLETEPRFLSQQDSAVGWIRHRILARSVPAQLSDLAYDLAPRMVGRIVDTCQNVMHDSAIARNDFDRANPYVMPERIRRTRILIVHDACGRHVVGWDLDDQIGFPERPLRPGLVLSRQRIGTSTTRGTGFDPMHEGVRLVDRHRSVADE